MEKELYIPSDGGKRRWLCFIAESADGDIYLRYFDLYSPRCEELINAWIDECETLTFKRVELRDDL